MIGAAGRLSPEKGFDVLVQAVPQVGESRSGCRAGVVWRGGERKRLRGTVAGIGIGDRFVLAGFTDRLDRYMPHFDLFVQSSYTEGLPNVLLEALAAGVPVVATDVGGTREVLDGGSLGGLVLAGDSAALAIAISECRQRNAKLEGESSMVVAG